MILEGLAFLGLPCGGWVAEAMLFAQGSERQQKKRHQETYGENEKGYGLKYMSWLCSSREGSKRGCSPCYFSPKSSSLVGALFESKDQGSSTLAFFLSGTSSS